VNSGRSQFSAAVQEAFRPAPHLKPCSLSQLLFHRRPSSRRNTLRRNSNKTGARSPRSSRPSTSPPITRTSWRKLCQHISYSRQLAEQLELLRHTPLTQTTLKAVKNRAAFVELLAMHRDQTKAIVSLSLKLRLYPSAYRRDGRTNERLARVSPSRPKPWLWARDRDDDGEH
jgi:hypothetical protein